MGTLQLALRGILDLSRDIRRACRIAKPTPTAIGEGLSMRSFRVLWIRVVPSLIPLTEKHPFARLPP